jgi:hypothetical protein
MLRTDDRALLSEALASPLSALDYELDLLVGTTYSLHLSALLSVPLSLTFADWEDAHGRPVSEPVASLEAVRRYADRLTVFCQAGATAATEEPPIVASWLEDVVVPVKAPAGGVFHPKVWVARYRSTDASAAPWYRMLCASRNLTFDRCWDTVLILDGEPSPRGGVVRETRPLADFVAELPALAVASVTPMRKQQIADLAVDLRHVRFEPPAGFDTLAFHPLGIRGHTADPFTTRRSRMLVIAPFIGSRFLARLATEQTGSNVLVSREEEFDQVATARLAHFSRICTLDDVGATREQTDVDGRLSGLHAKLYVADAGWDAHLWTGSANATSAAFDSNVEFLVRLDGRRSEMGVDAVLGDPKDPTSLAHVLVDVEARDAATEPDARVELERELDILAHDLAARQLTAVVTADELNYAVELVAASPPALPDDVQLRCWPLTDSGARHADPVSIAHTTIARFSGVALANITAFFVMELRTQRDDLDGVKSFLVRATLKGVPASRREAIMRELLADPEQVLRLLRALLTFDAADATEGVNVIAALRACGNGIHYEPPLLESLLKALAESPHSIEAVASLVDEIRAVGDDLLPPDFVAIWEPIAQVYHAHQGAPG